MMPVLFGPEAAGMNEQLHNMIRRASSKRDEHAPLYPTVDETKEIENHKHMQELREKYGALRDEKGGDHTEAKRAYAKIYAAQQDHAWDIVEEKREKYFAEADRRRALGQSTSDLLTPSAELRTRATFKAPTPQLGPHGESTLPSGRNSKRPAWRMYMYVLRRYWRSIGSTTS
jgi:hypothetical protein